MREPARQSAANAHLSEKMAAADKGIRRAKDKDGRDTRLTRDMVWGRLARVAYRTKVHGGRRATVRVVYRTNPHRTRPATDYPLAARCAPVGEQFCQP